MGRTQLKTTFNQPMTSGSACSFSWNYQQNHFLEGLKGLLGDDDLLLTDVTLACDGEFIQAHKLVLSLCSSFFRNLFLRNRIDKSNTIIVLGHVTGQNLRHLLHFMYHGSVNIPRKDVDSFLQAGKLLEVEGLMETVVPVEVDSCEDSICPTRKKRRVSVPATAVQDWVNQSKPNEAAQIFQEPESSKDDTDTDAEEEADEEGVDFNQVKAEPIQVYSGFMNSQLPEGDQHGFNDLNEQDGSRDVLNDTLSSWTGLKRHPPVGGLDSSMALSTPMFSSVPDTPIDNEPGPSSEHRSTSEVTKGRNRSSDGREKTSRVWNYFEKLSTFPKSSRCNVCSKEIRMFGARTGDLRKHLKRKHHDLFEEMRRLEN